MTSAMRLTTASPARATCEYSQRSRNFVQSGGRVSFSSRDLFAPNEKKPALRSPAVAVQGVSTVFGNLEGNDTYRIAREVIKRFSTETHSTEEPPPICRRVRAGR